MSNIELDPKVIATGPKMRDVECPHCHKAFHREEITIYFGEDADGHWAASGMLCPRPDCKRFSLYLKKGRPYYASGGTHTYIDGFTPSETKIIRPEALLPNSIPPGTPKEIERDYVEATMVLNISLNASAALSRRCLQNILRQRSSQDVQNFPQNGSLYQEIEAVMESKKLPPTINDKLHAIRELGNLAAHPLQDKYTSLIVPVELGEAKLILDIINDLLYYYYIQVPKTKQTIAGISKKIDATKKP